MMRSSKKPKPNRALDGGSRVWQVTRDPSGMFLRGVFRFSDVQAGGFDAGTIFTNVATGQQRLAMNDVGKTQIIQQSRCRPRRKTSFARVRVPTNKRATGQGGANAIAIL